jgi:hypothetical protein
MPGTLRRGKIVDRYGRRSSEFVADAGTPFAQRSLPSSYSRKRLNTFEVVKPIPGVRTGPSAPWFGQPGGGTQHFLPDTVGNLVKRGYLKPI